MKKMTALLLFILLFLAACVGVEENVEPVTLDVTSPLATVKATAIKVPVSPKQIDSTTPVSDLPPTETLRVIPVTPKASPVITPPSAYPVPEIEEGPNLPYPAPQNQIELTDPYPSSIDGPEKLPVFGYRVINVYPHDPEAYTQGLVVTGEENPQFIEGTGLWGESSLRLVNIETGEVKQFISLPDEYFGEGLTEFNNRIYQLTWRANIGFIYDSQSFELLGDFNYPYEGWGITHDGNQLIVSDGTPTIHFWDPETLNEIKQIQVTSPYGPISMLNELEYVEGEIFANIWQTDLIARISPETGEVLGWIDLTGLYDVGEDASADNVLNGIAYDEQTGKLFVTGKRWPVLFEIELIPNTS